MPVPGALASQTWDQERRRASCEPRAAHHANGGARQPRRVLIGLVHRLQEARRRDVLRQRPYVVQALEDRVQVAGVAHVA